MKPKKRQKLCTYCEGEVDLDVIVCPYCAADLREEKPEQHRPLFHSTSVRSLNEQVTRAQSHKDEPNRPSLPEMNQSLYPPPFPAKSTFAEESATHQLVSEEPTSEEEKSPWGAMLLLTLGAQLFLFGILMFLFSHQGILLLRWNASFWFLYFFASIPLLIFGYKALK